MNGNCAKQGLHPLCCRSIGLCEQVCTSCQIPASTLTLASIILLTGLCKAWRPQADLRRPARRKGCRHPKQRCDTPWWAAKLIDSKCSSDSDESYASSHGGNTSLHWRKPDAICCKTGIRHLTSLVMQGHSWPSASQDRIRARHPATPLNVLQVMVPFRQASNRSQCCFNVLG